MEMNGHTTDKCDCIGIVDKPHKFLIGHNI